MNEFNKVLSSIITIIILMAVFFLSGYYYCYKRSDNQVRDELEQQISINKELERSIDKLRSENEVLNVELSSSTARIKFLDGEILKFGTELQSNFEDQRSTIAELLRLESEAKRYIEQIRQTN